MRKTEEKRRSRAASAFMTAVLCLAMILGAAVPAFAESAAPAVRVAVPTLETNDVERVMDWLEENGFQAETVTPDEVVRADDFDALLIPGGGDVSATLYGQKNDSSNYFVNIDYDKFEITLVRMFAGAGKPVLGICRGEQLINVAFGGTLEQNIPEKHLDYREIRLEPSSFLYPALGEIALVYHNHHQCIDELGEDLEADAWDVLDGRIEGIHHRSLPIYGIQFHPELKDEVNGMDVIVGREFMNLCLDSLAKED